MYGWTHSYFYYPLLQWMLLQLLQQSDPSKEGHFWLKLCQSLPLWAVATGVKNPFLYYISYKQDTEKLRSDDDT